MKNKLCTRKNILISVDTILFLLGYIISFIITLNENQLLSYKYTIKQSFFLMVVIYLSVFYFMKIYDQMWRYANEREYQLCAISSILSGGVFIVLSEIIGYNLPIRIQIVSPLIIMSLIIASRISYKIFIQKSMFKMKKGNVRISRNNKNRLAIIGAGDKGVQLLREVINNTELKYEPVCFIDDNFQKIGRSILGIEICGPTDEIQNIVYENRIDTIIITLSSSDLEQKKRIVELSTLTKCSVKILPDIPYILKTESEEYYNGQFSSKMELISKLRNIEVEDLLQRDPIKVNETDIRAYINGSVVLVTGGGGSIGAEICRQVVDYGAKELIIVDNYENSSYEIEQELKRNHKFQPKIEIVTVRDYKALENVFKEYSDIYGNIDVVFHAAAHKHVPLMEKNIDQAVKNNLIGTYNVGELCNKYRVRKMILISTDKAVNPTNAMGATKRACEMVMQFMNKKSGTTLYSAVRFGNVLGSNGSVIPLFKKQIESGGPITVTHPEIIRYFMTIPEAVALVLNAGGMANGGEVFVLDMGSPVKILDLAKNMIKLSGLKLGEDIDIVFTGLRPGEKLYEELLIEEEGLRTTESEKIFIGKIAEMDEDELKCTIRDFKNNIENYTNEEIKLKMKKLVKTYSIN